MWVPPGPERRGALTSFSTMIKNYATFQSAFPDDSVEDEVAAPVPAGRALAEALASKIASAGSPYQHSFYGWKFDFKSTSGRQAWALVQQPGPWLLIVEAKVGWLESSSKKSLALEEVVRVVDSALRTLPDVSGVEWFTQDEFTESQRRK